MTRVLVTLALITALTAAGGHFASRELEKWLLASSCLPEPPLRPAVSAEKRPAPELTTVPAVQNFQIIVSRDIFRSAPQEIKPPPKSVPPLAQTVQPTALNLTLAGTVLGSGQTSRAIIINSTGRDQKQQLLQIGDGVPSIGAVIKEIRWDSVILEVNGRQETLTMPKPKSAPPGFSPQAMAMPPDSAMSEMPDLSRTAEQGRPPVRPNRRISLPPEEPEMPAAPFVDPPPEEEIPPPELSEAEEAPPPELPPPDAEQLHIE